MTQTLHDVARANSRRLLCCGMYLIRRYALLLLIAACGVSCGRREASKPAATPARVGPRKVVLQTDWFPQAEHGGFYQALAKGFYAEAGLDVDIWPGGPGSGIKV